LVVILAMPPKVLVVDDEPVILNVLAELLTFEGYRVRRAGNGRAALAAIADDPPDLVLSDVMMPGLDGVGLTRHLRSTGDQTPVVLISAVYADVDLPSVDFVPKPFDLDHLLRIIARAIEVRAQNGS
jgi:two-component system response regulator MprA